MQNVEPAMMVLMAIIQTGIYEDFGKTFQKMPACVPEIWKIKHPSTWLAIAVTRLILKDAYSRRIIC